MGTPARKTASAACGSAKMLNSAAGVVLPPSDHAPPMATIRATRSQTSGARANAMAMLVIGPSAQSVTDPSGSARSVSTMKSAAWPLRAMSVGSGRSGPSRPVEPCTYSAVIGARTSGAAAPA